MGSVGSFKRIQDFISIPTRQDTRKVLSKIQLLLDRDLQAQKKKSSFSDAGTEKTESPVASHEYQEMLPDEAIVIRNGSFGWDTGKGPLLESINITVPKQKITMIVGPVGCGKSILLKSILGEVPTMTGSVHLSSLECGFCDQTPWFMNGSVQQGIRGVDRDLDPIWYETVISACALEEDLQQLSQGDQTQIGSKGISLSGGQSQRIALARAVYAQKDLVILDDAMRGLDADTENRVFHNLLGRDGLLRKHNTTVLMTTSSAHRLPFADHIISLTNEGKVSEQGTFRELNSAGGYVSSFNLPPPEWNYHPSIKSIDIEKQKVRALAPLAPPEETADDISRRNGDISVYLYYIKAVGWIPTLIFVVAISGFIFCISFPAIWVKFWAASNAIDPNGR
jgi:ATP-binding cassette subfamily C (CFTR/MRP) protein 1